MYNNQEVGRRTITLNKYLEEEQITKEQLKEYVLEGFKAVGDKRDILLLRTWLNENRTFTKIKRTSLTIILEEMAKEGILIKEPPAKGKQGTWYDIAELKEKK